MLAFVSILNPREQLSKPHSNKLFELLSDAAEEPRSNTIKQLHSDIFEQRAE